MRNWQDNATEYGGAIPTDRFRACSVWGASRAARALHAVAGKPRAGGFGILMYHRVARPTRGQAKPTYSVTPERLREQLAGLLSRGWEPWTLDQVLAAHHESRPIPRNVFVVTFDDGYENNLTAALPVLLDLGVPATIFLATSFLDSDAPFPSDDWSLAGSRRVPATDWRPLRWQQCEALLASGLVQLGAHTHTHGIFAGREPAFREDLARCLDAIEQRLGIRNPPFAFPFGITSSELTAAAREMGVRCALTTRFACVQADCDPFDWGRFNVAASDSAAILAAKLAGWYEPVATSVRAIKHPLSGLWRRGRAMLSPAESSAKTPDRAANGQVLREAGSQ